MANLFERLDRGRPAPIEKTQEVSPAQKLLDWLQSWNKNTISMREIHIYGPNAVRGRERDWAETLMKYGWLVPAKKHRRDMHKWHVVRKNIVAPKVAT